MPRTIWSILFVMLLQPFATQANDELLRLQTDPSQWVMQRKNYAATGYSELSQITAENVKHLKPAWTFSTGVLRGHEGAPLVVGTTMNRGVTPSFGDPLGQYRDRAAEG